MRDVFQEQIATEAFEEVFTFSSVCFDWSSSLLLRLVFIFATRQSQTFQRQKGGGRSGDNTVAKTSFKNLKTKIPLQSYFTFLKRASVMPPFPLVSRGPLGPLRSHFAVTTALLLISRMIGEIN